MTNRCGGLLAPYLCGTSVASGKEIEYLGRHNESPGSQGPQS